MSELTKAAAVHERDALIAERERIYKEFCGRNYMHLPLQDALRAAKTVWHKTSDFPPDNGTKVIAYYKNGLGKKRRVMAFYAAQYTIEQNSEYDYDDYCEDDDTYYLPAGWHEVIDNWDDYSSVAIGYEVTHWTDIPDYPDEEDEK